MGLSRREKKILAPIESWQPELERELAELVAQTSHSADKAGVDALGERLEQDLMRLRFRVAEVVSGDRGRSLVARRFADESHRLLLLGHLDTVHPAHAEFKSLKEDAADAGRLLGPGAADMKGGLVVMLAALRALEEAGALEGRHLTVVLAADEEVGSPGSADLVRGEAADAHLCLGFEPGRVASSGAGTFVTARKGMGRFTLVARGKAAHAGVDPASGASAVRELAEKVVALEDLADPSRGTSVTVGTFHGGTVCNTVPEEAVIEVDYRFPDEDSGEELEDALLTAGGRHHVLDASGRPLVTTRIQDQLRRPAMVRTEAVERMARRITDWGAELGLRLEEESRGGSSDAALACDVGCPAVCGLGVLGGGFHTTHEWLLRSSLADRARLAALTISRFYEL